MLPRRLKARPAIGVVDMQSPGYTGTIQAVTLEPGGLRQIGTSDWDKSLVHRAT